MTFTYDDLKRLKEDHSCKDPEGNKGCAICCLIARLEAAETCLREAYLYLDSGDQYNFIDDLYEAWRKAKGEAGK